MYLQEKLKENSMIFTIPLSPSRTKIYQRRSDVGRGLVGLLLVGNTIWFVTELKKTKYCSSKVSRIGQQ